MPRLAITPPAAAMIAALHAAGKSRTEIARELADQLGVVVHPRSIAKHLARRAGRKQPRAQKSKVVGLRPRLATVPCGPATTPISQAGPPEEIPTLTGLATQIQGLLQGPGLHASDVARLSQELRQVLAQLRAVTSAQRAEVEASAVDDLRARLRAYRDDRPALSDVPGDASSARAAGGE